MWTIGELKENAKSALKRYYWIGFAVCLIAGVICGVFGGFSGGFSSSVNYNTTHGQTQNRYNSLFSNIDEEKLMFIGIVIFIFLIIYLIVLAVATCYSVFVSIPIQIGKKRFFVMARGFDNLNIGMLFSSFKTRRYKGCFKLAWAKTWRLSLWYMLFIIPGIWKTYQYCMAEYIIGENPQLDAKRALELSKQMTDGEKWHIFCLQLSFIGWYLLGICICCVGQIFVMPYYEAAMAELYTVLRCKAFSLGYTDEKELKGFDPAE